MKLHLRLANVLALGLFSAGLITGFFTMVTPSTSAQSIALSTKEVAPAPSFRNVVIVIFENADYSAALQQPFFGKLAQEGALLTSCMAERHPSQPNYIALVAGDTLGVTGDQSVDLDAQHLGNLLVKRGFDWRVYAENYPGNCFKGSASGRYVRKHVPFISFKNVQNDPKECAKIVNADQFQKDLTAGSLPVVSFYIPNLDHDGHDTNVKVASQWFGDQFGTLLADSKIMKDTLFIVTFDEADFIGPNQIYTVFYGANVIPHSVVGTPTNHYSLLRTLEDALHLGTLGRNDAKTVPVTGIWK